MILTRVSIILLTLYFASGKIYKRCELARELRNFDVAEEKIPTWVCIAQHESNFDTSAMNYGSGDHGLFQISQLYWCSPPGDGYGCNSPCSKFRDDDIADDLQCIRRIYNEHERISGDGFNAWVVYPLYCKGDNAKYVQGCYDEEPDIASNTTENEITIEEVDEYGDGYQFPALPSYPKSPKSDYGDGYEFPKLPYSEASIHRFVLTKNFSAQRHSKIIKHKLDKVPYSKTSIHHAVVAGSNGAYSNLPYSKISIHHAVSAEEKTFDANIIKLPYSKESIHHFIPINSDMSKSKVTSSKPVEEPAVDKEDLTTNLSVGNKGISSSTADELNDIGNTQQAITLTMHNQVPSVPVSIKSNESHTNPPPFSVQSHHLKTTPRTHLTSSAKSTKKYDFTNNPKAATETSSAKSNYFSTASNYAKNSSEKTTKHEKISRLSSMKKAEKVAHVTTTKTPLITTTFNPLTSSKSPTMSSRESVSSFDILSSTTIKESSYHSTPTESSKTPSSITMKTLLSSMKVSFAKSSVSTTKYFLTRSPTNQTSALSLHLTTPKALQQRAFFDLEGASSTFSPLRQVYSPPNATAKVYASSIQSISLSSFSTSSMKPLHSSSTSSPATRSNKEFSYKAVTATPPSTLSKLSSISTVKKQQFRPTKSFRDYKHSTPSTTTSKPSERQVTFAPDSFFSWLFSSQTLPPLVAPPRPQRPQGERPNFPRPGAPLGGTNVGIPRPPTMPQPITTRRPFPFRPSAPRPIRPQQRPFASATSAPRPPSYFSRKPLKPSAEHTALVVFREGATQTPKQASASTESSRGRSFSGVSSTVSSVRASEGREIKLNDNFVFVRTKYGYRLFRV